MIDFECFVLCLIVDLNVATVWLTAILRRVCLELALIYRFDLPFVGLSIVYVVDSWRCMLTWLTVLFGLDILQVAFVFLFAR